MTSFLIALAIATAPGDCEVPRHAPAVILCEGEPAPRSGFLIASEPMDRATACLEARAPETTTQASSFFVEHPALVIIAPFLLGFSAGLVTAAALD